ncbi:hypothetical protein FGO68_gene15513 [Halteria grandinella]|uniref:U-box domain-containing protein n=1 Tax=Halteria grandinella TaxID=5974 RepID=A0A8J8NMP8_HALGN|nr:hypothetical protein FGO68_gene15513 [Halteria grandinella]
MGNQQTKGSTPEIPQSIIQTFYCPISQEIMKDPVMTADGHSYEKKNIEKWLTNNNKSPLTGEVLTNKALIPNHSLRSTIKDFLSKNPIIKEQLDIQEAIKISQG